MRNLISRRFPNKTKRSFEGQSRKHSRNTTKTQPTKSSYLLFQDTDTLFFMRDVIHCTSIPVLSIFTRVSSQKAKSVLCVSPTSRGLKALLFIQCLQWPR